MAVQGSTWRYLAGVGEAGAEGDVALEVTYIPHLDRLVVGGRCDEGLVLRHRYLVHRASLRSPSRPPLLSSLLSTLVWLHRTFLHIPLTEGETPNHLRSRLICEGETL